MSSKLSEYVRNGDGVIQVDSMFADLSKMVIEKLSGNDKFKKHRKISNAPVRFFSFFLFIIFTLYFYENWFSFHIKTHSNTLIEIILASLNHH